MPDNELPKRTVYQRAHDILDHAWHFIGLRVCREHAKSDAADCDAQDKRWSDAHAVISRSAMELLQIAQRPDPRIANLETELAAAKATNAKLQKAANKAEELRSDRDSHKMRADNLARLVSDLQMANLERPDYVGMAAIAYRLLAGMKYVQFVADQHDVNRQLVCGMALQCRHLIEMCGTAPDPAVNPEDALKILTDYYAQLPARDIEAMQAWGIFHNSLPSAA